VSGAVIAVGWDAWLVPARGVYLCVFGSDVVWFGMGWLGWFGERESLLVGIGPVLLCAFVHVVMWGF
jgi:hypothetical protein